jgi:hypothetical protein
MVFAFDTLSYSRLLRERGVSQEHAEAHAEAARQFIMAELVTKQDLLAVRQDLQSVRQVLQDTFDTKFGYLDTKVADLSRQFDTKLGNLSDQFDTKLSNLSSHFDTKLENLSLRLTVRLGVLLVAGFGALAALIKLP